MTRLGFAAVLLVASTSLASAGTYVGLGIGTSADGNLDGAETNEGAPRSGRLLLGLRMSKLSLEGQVGRFDLDFSGNRFESTQAGLGLKLSIPLGSNFEAFARAGVQRTWLSYAPDPMIDAVGNGWFLGGGFEYRLNLGVTAASLFIDYQRSSTELTNNRMYTYDGRAGMWTLGATVSL